MKIKNSPTKKNKITKMISVVINGFIDFNFKNFHINYFLSLFDMTIIKFYF